MASPWHPHSGIAIHFTSIHSAFHFTWTFTPTPVNSLHWTDHGLLCTSTLLFVCQNIYSPVLTELHSIVLICTKSTNTSQMSTLICAEFISKYCIQPVCTCSCECHGTPDTTLEQLPVGQSHLHFAHCQLEHATAQLCSHSSTGMHLTRCICAYLTH